MCVCVGVNVHVYRGPGLLKAGVPRINIQAPTRFSKEEQGVMGDAEKINRVPSSEVERRKVRGREEHGKQHERKNKRQVFEKI